MNKDLQVVSEGKLSFIKFRGHFGYSAILSQVFREECRRRISELAKGADNFFEIFISPPDFRTEELEVTFRVVFPTSQENLVKELLCEFCVRYRISVSLEA